MVKKALALFISAIMVMAILAACSGDSGGASTSSADSSGGGSGSSSTAPAAGGGGEYEFNVHYSVPENIGATLKEYCDRITEQSDGQITFTHYYASSLMSIPEVPKGLQDGVADLAQVFVNNYQQQFPLTSQIFGVPFLGIPNVEFGSKLYTDLVEEFPELTEEFTSQGITPLGPIPNPPYQMLMAKEVDIKTPADLAGLKIITSSAEMSELIAANSGAPIGQPPTEFYASLEKGVADGVINGVPVGIAFGITPDLTKELVLFGDQGLYFNYALNCIRTESLEKLPEDLRALFFGENLEMLNQSEIGMQQGLIDNALNVQESAGGKITTVADADIEVWKDATADYRETTISALEADGHSTARDIYDRAVELIEAA